MQSVLLYSRLLARTLTNSSYSVASSSNGDGNNAGRESPISIRKFGLIAATSGYAQKAGLFSTATVHLTQRASHGDDACFVAESAAAHVMGVADGVGGWRSYGVDPSHFSSSLMETCARLVKQGKFTIGNPVTLLSSSYEELQQSKEPILGSSTACVLMLDKSAATMYSANLGDSGFLVIRDGQVVARSAEQQHYFNTPFQLACAPPHMGTSSVLSDSPESSDTSQFSVEAGDVIVLGTDGLFDNLSEEMILAHCTKLRGLRTARTASCEESEQSAAQDDTPHLQQVAHDMARDAKDKADDPDYISPFAKNANAHGINIRGGKPDDITVVLSAVYQQFE